MAEFKDNDNVLYVAKEESIFEKEIWNRAIEEAAKLAETSKGYPTSVSQKILRLKK